MGAHRCETLFVGSWLLFAVSARAADHQVIVGGTSPGGYYGNQPVLMFNPSALTIAAGDTVTFVNAGGTHNVDADDGSFRCARGCDGQGGNGDPSGAAWSATVRFGRVGTFAFHCDVHGAMGMTGQITVEAAPAAVNPNQHGLTGAWANPATAGQGLVMEIDRDFYAPGTGLLFAGWFTYDASGEGRQRWYTLQGQVHGDAGSATMPIYLTQGGRFHSPAATTTAPVGESTIRFDDCTHGTLDYRFSDGSGRIGSIPLTRLDANVSCTASGDGGSAATAPGFLLAGAWADPGDSGQGLVLDVNPPLGLLFAAWYTYAADAGPDSGPAGQHWFTLQALVTDSLGTIDDIGIYDTTGGVFDSAAGTTTQPVGSARLVFASCSSAMLSYRFTSGAQAGTSGTLALTRLGAVPDGCAL
jgi:plastocyanin